MKKPKCLVLFSGGLDSRLACKIMQEQAEVTALFFLLPFSKFSEDNIDFCKKNEIKLEIVDCTKSRLLNDYLDMIRHPKYGRGTGINPCIDCHAFMLKLARQYADKNKIEIIATGEVLGERPMSQHKKALEIIEEESGLGGRLLRPLSAKLLEETGAEKTRKIDRSKLFDIHGRGREKQIELAEKYNIDYPNPAGGCLLCEPALKEKIRNLLKKSEISQQDITLELIGRHIDNIILGRNEKENKILTAMKGIKIIPSHPGPTAFVQNKEDIEKAKELMQKYSKHKISNFQIKSD